MQEGFGMSTKWEFTEAERNFQNMVDEQFLGIKSSWATADYQDLQKIINTDGDFMGASIALWKKKSEWLSLSLPSRKAELEAWLTKISKDPTKRTAAKLKYGFKWQYVDFDTFLDKEGKNPDIGKANRTALHIAMWWDAADNAVNKREDLKNITYDQLLNNVYHQSTK